MAIYANVDYESLRLALQTLKSAGLLTIEARASTQTFDLTLGNSAVTLVTLDSDVPDFERGDYQARIEPLILAVDSVPSYITSVGLRIDSTSIGVYFGDSDVVVVCSNQNLSALPDDLLDEISVGDSVDREIL